MAVMPVELVGSVVPVVSFASFVPADSADSAGSVGSVASDSRSSDFVAGSGAVAGSLAGASVFGDTS
jgi:hypothetical protein